MKSRRMEVLIPVLILLVYVLAVVGILKMNTKSVDVTRINDVAMTIQEKGMDAPEVKKLLEQYQLELVNVGEATVIYEDMSRGMIELRNHLLLITTIAAGLCLVGSVMILWKIEHNIRRPFQRMKRFATNVAAGNLDMPLQKDRGNLFGEFTESFDIMREELARARDKEKQLSESKKELVAALSHDIKTPLASISAMAEILEVTTKDAIQREKLEAIQRKSDQILMLINNLFHATMEELEELTVERSETLSKELTPLILTADYEHKAEVEKLDECLVYCDKLRFQQVMDNLFSNSYKYAGTAIHITSFVEGEYLKILIADDGPGVKPEEMPLLFQKFYRGSNSEGIMGSGIGLYISRIFLEQMGGSLELTKDCVGFGVTLSLKLVS